MRSEIDRISSTTTFNGIGLVDGSLASSVVSSNHIFIQVGIDNSTNSRINLNQDINLTAVTVSSLGIDTLSVSTAEGALTALDSINSAIASVAGTRGKVGAVQNRLARTISNLSTSVENLAAAESQIRDADIAEEIALR